MIVSVATVISFLDQQIVNANDASGAGVASMAKLSSSLTPKTWRSSRARYRYRLDIGSCPHRPMLIVFEQRRPVGEERKLKSG
jgi:hypothetical protein